MKEPKLELIQCRRCIDEFSQIKLLNDLTWDEIEKVWFLHIQYVLKEESKLIEKQTEWYITLSDNYPIGNINIYPAVKNGICNTFYHQNNNGVESQSGLWRKGKLCLDNPINDAMGLQQEPNSIQGKLRWHLERFILWVETANKNELISKDDFFELPALNINNLDLIVFDEDLVSYMEWEDSGRNSGIFTMVSKNDIKYVNTFVSLDGTICRKVSWGDFVPKESDDSYIGIWILLNEIPVIKNWQAPNTFGELKDALNLQGVELKSLLSPLLNRIRDGKKHYMLIGFPVPERFGDKPFCYHWWSCMLPVLSSGNKIEPGFRRNSMGWLYRDYLRVLNSSTILNWSETENWNQKQTMQRGMFDGVITKNRFIIIGGGAVGSMIAEQLVRSGMRNISIMDADKICVGNLTRHTLTIDDVDKYKSKQLAKRLNSINCHVRAQGLISFLRHDNIDVLNKYDVIIDCTGKDDVLNIISDLDIHKFFCSVSVGYKAERMYFVYNNGQRFNSNMFFNAIHKYVKADNEMMSIDGLPWDGIGCWHPVFPAYAYDIQLATTVATMVLTGLISKEHIGQMQLIYEKKYDENGLLVNYERIYE